MATLEGDAEECLLVVGKGRREMSLRGIRRKTGRSTGRQDVMIWKKKRNRTGKRLPHSVGITEKKKVHTYSNVHLQSTSNHKISVVSVSVGDSMDLSGSHDGKHGGEKTQCKRNSQANLDRSLEMQPVNERHGQEENGHIT